MRTFIKKYFSFNKRERNGFLLLASAIFILIVTNLYFKSKKMPISISFQPLASNQKNQNSGSDSTQPQIILGNKNAQVKDENGLFAFDPNSISEEQAMQLGFSKKTAGTLLKFRSKGGKFKAKEDLKKIYGLSEKLYVKLEPFIAFARETKNEKDSLQATKEKKLRPVSVIELNSADSVQLVSLNGIGPVLARRILTLRTGLGGFYAPEQLKEVYGLKDTLYDLFSSRIKTDAALIKKINVNTASIDEMKKHIYIKFVVASSIVNYRNKHGKFSKAEDLLNVGSISEENIRKLKPYLEF